MPTATYRDKLGRTESIPVQAGQPIVDVLRAAGIPRNGVLTRVNGVTVAEEVASVGAEDHVEFVQVRHYDLGTTRSPARKTYGAEAYGKTVWSRHPWLVPSCRWRIWSDRIEEPSSRQRWRQDEFVSRESTAYAVRPLRGECRDAPAVPVCSCAHC